MIYLTDSIRGEFLGRKFLDNFREFWVMSRKTFVIYVLTKKIFLTFVLFLSEKRKIKHMNKDLCAIPNAPLKAESQVYVLKRLT